MSIEYELETIGQPNIYNPQIRRFNVYFDLPDNLESQSSKLGILLLVSGFGGHSQSKVYMKMRKVFADTYNLITVQCDYFGSEFMQNKVLEENVSNFCEMGPTQAMDNLIALKCVKDWLDENKIEYDATNVIAYGHSHGAYLCYLINALMPNVLSTIIDNSAWIFPEYIDKVRILWTTSDLEGNSELRFSYIIGNIIFDREIYYLEKMYRKFLNEARIISFHGGGDNLISINDKLTFLSDINNSSIEVFGKGRVNEVFKSCAHGLGADFLKMFDYVYNKYITNSQKTVLKFEDRIFETSKAQYRIDNSDGIPVLYIIPR